MEMEMEMEKIPLYSAHSKQLFASKPKLVVYLYYSIITSQSFLGT